MKKILSLFLSLALILAFIPSDLFSIKTKAIGNYELIEMEVYSKKDGIYYDIGVDYDTGEYYAVVAYIEAKGDVVIPSTFAGYPVKEIDSRVLTCYDDFRVYYEWDNTGVTSVTIPSSVTKMDNAFSGYTFLKKVVLSDGIKSIGEKAFYGCTALSDITIPDSVEYIGANAFSGTPFYENLPYENGGCYLGGVLLQVNKSASGEFNVKNGTKVIAGESFKGCKEITSVNLPQGLTTIGNRAFNGCSALLNIDLPDSLEYIEEGAFSGCSALTGITIPKNIKNISPLAFSGCTNLKNITVEEGNGIYHSEGNCIIKTATNTVVLGCPNSVIPDYVTAIGEYAFFKFPKAYIKIPDGVTEIKPYAFEGSALERIEMPQSIEIIDEYAFTRNSNLETVVLSESLKEVKRGAFSYCTKIKNVYHHCLNSKTNIEIANPTYSYGGDDMYNITFRNASWKPYHDIDENNGVTYAPTCTESGYTDYVCSDCSKSFPQDVVLALGHDAETTGACDRCDTLVWEFAVSGGEATIISYADCLGDSIIIPSSLGGYPVTTIEMYAFADNTTIKRVTIPDSVKVIGNSAFKGCKNLQTVEFSPCLVSIGNSSFSGCESLRYIELPETVTSIGNSAFNGCRSLISAYLPSSLTNLGMYAFYSCQNLEVIRMPSSLQTIKENTFYNCFALDYIEIPSNLTKIEKGAFYSVGANFTVYMPESKTKDSVSVVAEKNGAITDAEWKKSTPFEYSMTAPTCTDNGTVRYAKSGISYSAVIASLGHGETEIMSRITPSTCTDNGAKHYTLSCGHEKTYSYGISSKGHVYPYEVTVVSPSCIEEGGVLHSCSRCGDSFKLDVVPKTDHVYVKTITPPTCTSEGFTTHKCVCNDSFVTDIVPKISHSFALNIIVKNIAPTCTEDGLIIKACDNCGEQFKETVSKLGHNMKFAQTVAATPTSQGYDIFVCANGCKLIEYRNYTNYAPDAPTDRVDGVKTVCTDVDVTLSWNAFGGAIEYYAKVYDKDFTKCLKTITTKGTSAVFDFNTLKYNTDYKFIVTAKLASGKYLTVANASRVDGKMVIGDRVVGHTLTMEGKGAVIDFLPVENATEYLVNVFENDAQGTRIYTATLGKDTTTARVMTNLSAGTKYVVMINAKVGGKYMPLSDLRANGVGVWFTAPVINPTSYTIAAQTATTIRFSWDAVRGATEYFVRVKEKATGKLVNTLHTVNGKTTVALARYSDGTRISPDTTYTLEFCAYVPKVAATYGAPVDITTGSFEDITLSARNVGKVFHLSWNKTTNAVSYFVYVYKNGVKVDNFFVDGADNTYYSIYNSYGSGDYTFGVIACESNTSGTGYTPLTKTDVITVK